VNASLAQTGDHGVARTARARIGRAVSYATALVVMLFVVRLLGATWPKFPPQFPDSFSYLAVATRGPFQPAFWADERPVLFPLLVWSVGRSTTLVVVAQTAVYLGAFGALCMVAWHALRSRVVASVAIVAIAAIAAQPRFALWNTQVLSESLSLSLAVIMIAAWWWFGTVGTPRSTHWAWAATAAWVLVRDTNVLPTVIVIVPVTALAWLLTRGESDLARPLVAGAMIVTLVCGYVYVAQAVTGRNRYPLNNNVGMRILPDAALTRWFVGGGMPVDEALRERIGHDSWADGEAFLRDPRLARYRQWARGPGQRRFALSMVMRFTDWRDRLAHDLPGVLRDDLIAYDSFHVHDRLPARIGPQSPATRTFFAWAAAALGLAAIGVSRTATRDHGSRSLAARGLAAAAFAALVLALGLGAPVTLRALGAWTLGAATGIAVAFAVGSRRLAIVAAVGLASAFADVYISYVGDAVEFQRHLVGPLARVAVTVVVCVAIGSDHLLTRTSARADGSVDG
jgi:hypothetical protein